jgi:hypothetical protein
MKRIVLTFALALSMSVAGAATASETAPQSAQVTSVQPGEAAEPLLVLVEANPWALVLGSDSPKLALYDDGVVIYQKDGAYLAARLDTDDVQNFMDALQLEALTELAGNYSISELTDQPTTEIFLWADGQYKRIWIYGSLNSEAPDLGPTRLAGLSQLPPQVAASYRRMSSFDRPDAVAWAPEAIEVMISPYEHAPDESIIWPSRWPGLDHPGTRQRGNGLSLFIPASEDAALRAFLQEQRELGAVLIDGRKWAVSTRFPFPKEDRWMSIGAD